MTVSVFRDCQKSTNLAFEMIRTLHRFSRLSWDRSV
jgi:hypothetical protein